MKMKGEYEKEEKKPASNDKLINFKNSMCALYCIKE